MYTKTKSCDDDTTKQWRVYWAQSCVFFPRRLRARFARVPLTCYLFTYLLFPNRHKCKCNLPAISSLTCYLQMSSWAIYLLFLNRHSGFLRSCRRDWHKEEATSSSELFGFLRGWCGRVDWNANAKDKRLDFRSLPSPQGSALPRSLSNLKL